MGGEDNREIKVDFAPLCTQSDNEMGSQRESRKRSQGERWWE
jgi:hypothetical protein